ncbi:MAG: diacylglycerol kinase [Actinobacteria bacterium]|nr:MAG: diacylglycerol kinase [Actinomycetota bacterium]
MHMLVSSTSARGRAISVGHSVIRALRAGGWKVTVTVTTPEDDPREVAAHSEAPLVAALGGDGYISAVAEGTYRSKKVLVPFPGGRGNDLCRALGVGANPVRRAQELAYLGLHDEQTSKELGSRIQPIDALWVTDSTQMRRLVLGVVSLGYEALANEHANASWFRSGLMAYAYGAVSALFSYKPRTFNIEVDGIAMELSGWVVSVSNSGYVGSGIRLVPDSRLDDGVVELMHVGPVPARSVVPAIFQILVERNAEHPLITVHRAHTITLTEPQGCTAWADGDPIASIPLTLNVEKNALSTLI